MLSYLSTLAAKAIKFAVTTVVTSDEFRTAVTDALKDAISSSKSAAKASALVNDYVGLAVSKFDSLGLKGRLLKGYLVQLLGELARDDEQLKSAIASGQPFVQAVLDGIDPDEIASATTPVLVLLQNRAYAVAQEKGFL